MLITTLLLAAMTPASDVAATRTAFTKCMRDHMKKSLQDKMPVAEYDMALKSTCSTERDAFRIAVIAFGRASGDSQANAQEDADMQIEDYHATFAEKFADYVETNTLPAD